MTEQDLPAKAQELPDVLPITTTSRWTFELRAVSAGNFEWFAVARPGEKLSAVVSMIGYIAMRDEVTPVKDPVEQCYKAAELARVEAFHKGTPVGGIEAIPQGHHMSLINRIVRLSQMGVDPFFAAPAES